MVPLVQIVAHNAPVEAIAAVEEALAGAGIETVLRIFGQDADRNAVVAAEIAESEVAGAHPLQVWIVPPQFLTLELAGSERVAKARALMDFGLKHYAPRLFVTLGDVHLEAPSSAKVMDIERFAGLSSAEISALFT